MGRIIFLAGIVFLAIVGGVFAFVLTTQPQSPPPNGDVTPATDPTTTIVEDNFDSESLDTSRWTVTRKNDFNVSTVEVANVGTEEEPDRRLKMTADTMGTDDATVKFHGVRSTEPIDFSEGATFEVTLDWNDQANGSYLTAGLFLCPTATDGNPYDEADWVQLEYLGVPPGKNGRAAVYTRTDGRLPKWVHDEGFPKEQRVGRAIGVQKIEIRIDAKGLLIRENGKKLYEKNPHELGFTKAYLYLQMSSHSNYRARTLTFDSVRISPHTNP